MAERKREEDKMPAVSKKQRIAMAIAEHHPDQVFERNKGMLDMTQGQLHDFASTKEKNLPVKVKKSVKGSGIFTDQEIQQGFKKLGE